jgi:hypothetical protein
MQLVSPRLLGESRLGAYLRRRMAGHLTGSGLIQPTRRISVALIHALVVLGGDATDPLRFPTRVPIAKSVTRRDGVRRKN